MSPGPYPPPIDKLLTYGNAWEMMPWPDYRALAIGPEHIPDLTRLAIDPELYEAETHSLAVWAPAHAWRALGQLGAAEAAEPLTSLFRRIDEDDDDFINEDLPLAFGLIGEGAIPALTTFLADTANGLWARVAAAQSLKEIAVWHAEAHDRCVAVLTRQLEHFPEQDPDLNAFLVIPLLELRAAEAAPLIERAYAAGKVEEQAAGDWEDAQVDLGLLATRTTPRRRWPLLQETDHSLQARTAAQKQEETTQRLMSWHPPERQPGVSAEKRKRRRRRKK